MRSSPADRRHRDDLDRSGRWPALLPDDLAKWVLDRAVIYLSVAAAVAVLFIFVAAKMAGYSLQADGLMLGCVGLVIARQVGLLRP